jgi:hypothetical protein
MSKTNDTSKLGPATQDRELLDDDLDAMSGGEKGNLYVGETVSGRRIQKFFPGQ